MLLHHRFLSHARAHPDRTALVVRGASTTYGELLSRAGSVAATLQAAGVRRGDRVALYLNNSAEFVTGVFGTLMAGAVFMPVNPMTKADKLAYMLNDAAVTGLLTERSLAWVWQPAIRHCASLKSVRVHGEPLVDTEPGPPVGPWPTGMAEPPDDRDVIDQDLAALIYTSGSTGLPKGVMLTHLNMVSAARSVSQYLGLADTDVIYCALPLAFDYGLYQVLMALSTGASVVLASSFAFPAESLATMARHRVTVFPGVPTMFSMVLGMSGLERFDLSAVRLITNTAAALSERHIQDLRRLFPQARLFSMYGLTECKRVTYLPPEQLDIRPTSVGRGMPNEEVWLVDELGQRLPNGSVGELVIRGSNVMRGYWNAPEETARKLRDGPIPGERLLYSGDIFRTDAEGWLYFVGRKDDILKSRGEKVSPREVENAIYALDGVGEVAVVGVPDDLLGQAVKAIVERTPGSTLTERDVIRHCMGTLESFMVPKYVEFIDRLPRTDTGKIRKTGLA